MPNLRTTSMILTMAKAFMCSWAIIAALKGTFKRLIKNDNKTHCHTQLAATILSAGIFSCELTNHNPIVSPIINMIIPNVTCILKLIENNFLRCSVSLAFRPNSNVIYLLMEADNDPVTMVNIETAPPTTLKTP